jgi:hypothetical protein
MTNQKDAKLRLLSANNEILRTQVQDPLRCLEHALDSWIENSEALRQQGRNLQQCFAQFRRSFAKNQAHPDHRGQQGVPEDMTVDQSCLTASESYYSDTYFASDEASLPAFDVFAGDIPTTNDGPANDGPANDGPANDGPANDGPANDGPTTPPMTSPPTTPMTSLISPTQRSA